MENSRTPPTSGGRETRDTIRRSSLELFQNQGFRGTSMADIADASGITKAGVYYYFKTKNDLLDFVYETVNETLSAAVLEATDPTISVQERLIGLVRAQVGNHIRYRGFLTVFWRERHELAPEARERLRHRERRYEQTVLALLREGQGSGLFKEFDPEVKMSAILGLLSTVYRWAHHLDKSADEISDEISDLILHGIAEYSDTATGPKGERMKRDS